MTDFVPKKIIETASCGEKLKEARLKKKISLAQISKIINIKESYLIYLEENRFDKLPAGLYGKSFIKEYGSFLKLNVKELLIDWQKQIAAGPPEDPFSRKIIARHKFIIFPRLIKNSLIVLGVIICFLYLIFYFKKITLPPTLIITYPETNLALKDAKVTITGQTEAEAEIKINDTIVLNNSDGYFSQTINLKQGLNNIIIKAKKKYSREQIISRQLLVE